MYYLAQINIAEQLYPKGDERIQPFFDAIPRINELAERSTGFVWRLRDEDDNATSIRWNDNDMLIVNMSVWESVDALHAFTYATDHVAVYRQRRDWFHKMPTMHMALWYVPIGTIPTLDDARLALHRLDTVGATPLAFTFKQRFSVEEFLAARESVG
jgi:hypothetical protein